MSGSVELLPGLSDEARREFQNLVESMPAAPDRPRVSKRAISASEVLNEAHTYDKPASFSRGMRVELPGCTMLFLSGTASVDEHGATVHAGDLGAQCLRTFRNLGRLLAAEGADWHDVVRTTCYLRDIERDYDRFNEISTGIQVRLCRSDLLVEIEAIAMVHEPTSP